MKEKQLIVIARAVSMVFTPFYLSLVGMIALFLARDMKIFRLEYKLEVLLVVYLFTILLPTIAIRYYRKFLGWTHREMLQKERRMVPYIISIVCYFMCYHLMNMMRIPHFMSSIILASLSIQIVCAVINVWWKISTHTAAIGGVAGALVAFSLKFVFNPVWWLCFVILMAGLVGTSRMILRQHSLAEVVAGFLTGFLCSFFIILRF
ncbi:MAG: hypothetical protein IJ196_07615 [Prevotella sp.]|nr:hypothetical protein [Prevotella sp.]